MKQIELEKLVKYHQEKYYNDEPEISDAEFDELWDELRINYPKSELLKKVGEGSWEGFKKEKHIMPMNSQQKAGTIAEFEKWNANQKHPKRIIEYKCDGISLSIQYEKGNFVRALTRGNGDCGDDISKNVRQMDGFKNKIDKNYTGAVRCEIVMLHSVFDKKYKGIKKNPRNTAGGIAKQKDGNNYNDVSLIYYDSYITTNNFSHGDEYHKLKFLENEFGNKNIVVWQIVDANKVTEIRNEIMENRNSIPYDIDGLVIKNIEIDFDDMQRTTPNYQIAYKFETEKAYTKLIDVEWSATGKYLTPVGIVEPVELNGTTVQRASLANLSIMNDLNIRIGDIVEISKRGEIIPKIERLYEKSKDSKPIKLPTHCECGALLKSDDVFLYCPGANCHLKILHKLKKWIWVLDVKFMGITMIETLFQKGLITKISDFYTQDLNYIISKMENEEGFSARNITKAFDNLYKANKITLPQFIGGYDISGVGQRVIENIIDNSELKTLDDFLLKSGSDLAKIKQIGAIKARQIFDGLHENNLDMLETLNSGKIEIIVPQKSSDKLKGLSFCITGKLNHGVRDEYIEKIKDNGGQYKGVSKDLSYLINNDTTSSSGKNKKAKELNIPIISEDEFLKML
jgi:DNA ligase (NAD+)